MSDTQNTNQSSDYQKRIPIFTRSIKGKFRSFKTSVLILAYTVFFGLLWLPWDRPEAPSQAVLFDMVGRRFFIFDLVVYPQDLLGLSILLFFSATLLFFVTGLFGRAFCGYFCFQTIWTDFFIFIEHWFQGERPARTRLHKQAWNGEKLAKVGGTHLVWLLVSFWTAFTFTAYFTYAPSFLGDFFTGDANSTGYFSVLIITITTYLAAGIAREQVCMYMCPYSRFQSVMYEPQTLVVVYDKKRGEGENGRIVSKPGLKTKEERQSAGHGDCIDCGLCVQVCPVGIDIRNGLQYPCISCGLCIDACNTIMDSMKLPHGLVRYDSEENMKRAVPHKPEVKWKRLRTVGYGIAMIVMIVALVLQLGGRTSFEESVQQVRNPLFTTLADGSIRNRYDVRITNKAVQEDGFDLDVRGIPTSALILDEADKDITVSSGKSRLIQVGIKLTAEQAEKVKEFEFVIKSRASKEERIVKVRFSKSNAD